MSETWLEIVVSYCGDSLTKTKKIASYFQYSGYTEDEVRSLSFLMPGSFCLNTSEEGISTENDIG